MKSIFPQPISLGDLLVDRVRPHMERQRLVESRVKESDAGDTGEFFLAKPDDLQG